MKTEIVFKLQKEPDGYKQIFAPNCKVEIKHPEGLLYLNYEERSERIVGRFENLRIEGEAVLADVELFDNMKSLESRFEYAINGFIKSTNENNEVTSILVKGVGALMHNKF